MRAVIDIEILSEHLALIEDKRVPVTFILGMETKVDLRRFLWAILVKQKGNGACRLVGVPLSLTPESPKEQDGGEQVGFPARVGTEHQMEPCESGLR